MKSDLIKNAVRARVYSMGANQRIPSRYAMCMQYNASRSTVDKVISELVEEGVLYAIQGSGTYVSPEGPGENAELPIQMNTWAILIPDVRSDVYPELFRGIDGYAREHNIALITCHTNDDPLREYSYIQTLVASNISGFIIVPALLGTSNMKGYEYLRNRNIPFLFWNRSFDNLPDVPQICLNGYHGSRLAVAHLLEKGYKRIAYIAPARFRSSMDRFFGYCSALEDAGHPIHYEHVMLQLTEPQEEKAYACARAMLNMPDPPDAFLCFTDTLAIPVTRAIREKGLRISDDVGIIGFESAITPADHVLGFNLTYVSINSYESGRYAGKLLDEMIRNTGAHVPLLNVTHPRLAIRDSCKGPVA